MKHRLLSLLFVLLGIAAGAQAQNSVAIDAQNFPDENFRNWLLAQDYGSDGYLSDSEIDGVTRIDVPSLKIASLTGIEFFTKLASLACNDNLLTTLDVSKNSALGFLDCSANQLTTLDVTSNTTLIFLYCNANKLKTLDVSKNPILSQLSFYENAIRGEGMTSLINSLPTVSGGLLGIHISGSSDDRNKITAEQVAAAKAKGWTAKVWTDDEWVDFEGDEGGEDDEEDEDSGIIDLTGYTLIAEKDWKSVTDEELPWIQFADPENGSASISTDGLVINVTQDVGEFWLPQALIVEGFDLEEGRDYKVVVTAKFPCDGQLQLYFGNWQTSTRETFSIKTTDDFQQVGCDFSEFFVDAANGHLRIGCGNLVGTTVIQKVEVYVKGSVIEKKENESIKISDAKQVPYCSKYDLDFTDKPELKAYVATGYDKTTGTIWMTRVKQVPAGTGFLLIGDAGDFDIPVAKSASNAYFKNMFKGTLEGTTIQTTEGEYTNYYLSKGTSGVGFYKVTNPEGQKIGANRCYLPILTDIPAEGNEGDAEVIKVSAAKQVPYYTSKNIDFTSLDAQGVKAYTATGYNYGSGVIWLTRVKKVPAQTGILVMADEAGEYSVPTTSVASHYENMFTGSEAAQTIYTTETVGDITYINYYLSNGTSGIGFYKVTNEDGVSMGANRSYLQIPKRDTAAGARGIESHASFSKMIISDNDDDVIAVPLYAGDATGIEVQSSMFNVPSNNVYYNLQGQRVNNPGKGLYIRNGKKVVIK